MRAAILCFAFGVWLLQQQARLPGAVFCAWALALLLACALLCWRARASARLAAQPALRAAHRACGAALAALAGFMWAAAFAQLRLAHELPLDWEGRDIEVTGVVADLPQRSAHGWRFAFDVERAHTPGALVPPSVLLNSPAQNAAHEPRTPPRAGERWRLTVRLKRPHASANPQTFDYEVWLLEHAIRATGYVRLEPAPERLASQVWRPGYVVDRLRQAIRERILAAVGDRAFAPVLVALAIGDQSGIAQSHWDVFWRTGIGHLVSISGLHITMIAGAAFALVAWLWRRWPGLALRVPARKAGALAGFATAACYSILAGLSVPTQRTMLSLAVMLLALLLDRVTSVSRVLCAALLVVLLVDPWATLAAGFWLSFGAVALIVWVAAQRAGRVGSIELALSTQWAVTLGMIPLLLGLFHRVSLISPLANALAIPVVSFVVVPLTLLGTIPGFEFLLSIAAGVFEFGMRGLAVAAAWPGASASAAAPPPWAIAAGALGALWLLAPRGTPARWLGALWLLPLWWVATPRPGPGEFWLTVLDVGQGLAATVHTQRHVLLYDTGPRFSVEADSGKRIVVPYLQAAGSARLDALIVSHADQDHSGSAASVLAALPVARITASLAPGEVALPPGTPAEPCRAGQSWNWDGVRFEVLHPSAVQAASNSLNSNNRGCVLRIASAFGAALLPADIEWEGEIDLTATRASALRAEVLVAPHHGSRTSSSERFLRAVAPRDVIVSAGYRNRFRHPHPEVLQRYDALGLRVWRTDRDGAITVRFAAQGRATEAYRQSHARYWYGR